ncbi:MAG: lysoplasmalogenase [Acutalibacteraceae bacterium]
MAYYCALIPGLIVSFVFCLKRRKGCTVENMIFKAASSLCYLITCAVATASNPDAHIYGALIVIGGAMGLVGDIALDLKGIYQQDESQYLKAGFAFFIVGHILYTAAVINSVMMKWWVVLLSVAAGLILGALGILGQDLLKVNYGKYKKIVFAYGAFLGLTAAVSLAACIITNFRKEYVLMMIGANMFMLSDAVLCGIFFGENKNKSSDIFINHIFYYAAQYLIAASVMFM